MLLPLSTWLCQALTQPAEKHQPSMIKCVGFTWAEYSSLLEGGLVNLSCQVKEEEHERTEEGRTSTFYKESHISNHVVIIY